MGGLRMVPSLTEHLQRQRVPLAQVLPDLWSLFANPRHLNAFALTFVVMIGHMLVIPFIAPTLVANHGVAPARLSWLYMAGGAATFFTSRRVGELADRYGKKRVFRIAALLSVLPVLFVTHLPDVPFYVMVLFFPVFMVALSSRMVPMQALLTTVPAPQTRGAFLSANSAVQAMGTGCGAWFGGLLLSTTAQGQIAGFGTVGWLAAAAAVLACVWIGRVRGAGDATAGGAVKPAAGVEVVGEV
jgi:predicted MFS family arabinose efflux permease